MPRSPLKRSLSESPVLLPASLPQVPSTPTSKRSKLAAPSTPDNGPTSTSHAAPLSASAKSKLAILSTSYGHSPFPSFSRPTPEECQQVHDLLSSVHGVPRRPSILIDRPGAPAGCGEVPSVLDALIRTLLSQNTSSRNSTNAKEGMDRVYGRANYRAVLDGGAGRLEEAIRSGGLAKKKAAAIIGVLQWLDEREEGKGELSMQYLREMDDRAAMEELCSLPLVGVKTASCVLLFCLGRDSFAVDTHVHRLSLSLSWLPPTATRDQAFFHLDTLIPSFLKYGLHSLLVSHGRGCKDCSANGVTSMDFVETCPVAGLMSRKRKAGGKGKAKAGPSARKKVGAKKEEEPGEGEEEKVVVATLEEEVVAPGHGVPTTRRASPRKPKVEVKVEDKPKVKGAMHGLDG